MPDYNAPDALPEFTAAAIAAEPPAQAMVTMQLDAEIVTWFQQNQPQGMTWQQDMNSVLRFYMDSMQAMDAAAPPPGPESDFTPF